MNVGTLLNLEDFETDGELRDACRAIVLGQETRYEFNTRGAGRSLELIVAELERLRKQSGGKAQKRRDALVEGVRTGGLEIATRIEHSGDLSADAATLVGNWAILVGLMDQPGLDAVAQQLFAACMRYADASRRAFLAAAEAVTSTFADADAGVRFWAKHLKTQARTTMLSTILCAIVRKMRRFAPESPASS